MIAMLSAAVIAAYLGGVTGQDAYLAELEAGAVADVEALTGHHLGIARDFVDVRDVRPAAYGLTGPEGGYQPQRVKLSQPVAAVADLTIEERTAPGQAWTEVEQLTEDDPPLDVFELSGHWLTRVVGSWPVGPGTVRVSYSFGYAVDHASIPAGFRSVVLDLVAARYVDPSIRKIGDGVTELETRGARVRFGSGGSGGARGIPADLRARILGLRAAGAFS